MTPKQIRKRKRKREKKRRNYWNILIENPFSEKVEWHHINDIYVIAIPKDLHRLYQNSKGDKPEDSKIIHRENLKPILKQIYGERIYFK